MTLSVAERVRALRTTFPRAFGLVLTILALLVGANTVAALQLWRNRDEVARLRAGMTEAERNRTDLAIKSKDNRAKVVAELIRRQARADRDLHLTVDVGSKRLFLERDGVALREVPIAVGVERRGGSAPDSARVAVPRGAQTVSVVLGANDDWEVPAWVFADRALPLPPDRRVKGALGRNALVLNGGSVIYALPKTGPLADSSYVLRGSILLRIEDLRAIAPNITRGMTVYLYE
jgi:hypothetical protein